MKFKTRNTYKRHLRTRHGKELGPDGIRMMPREQFLLIRTKPYLHDDQTTPEDVLQGLLSGQQTLEVQPEGLVISEGPSSQQEVTTDTHTVYEGTQEASSSFTAILVPKLEPE